MTIKRVKPGIKGIRTLLASEALGWQCFVDGEFRRFEPGNLTSARCFYADLMLTGIQGNTVSFSSVAP